MRPNLNPTHGVHDTTNRHIRAQTPQRNDRIHGQGNAEVVVSVDGGGACGVYVLPYAEVVVDEGVVHPEDRVTWGGRYVGHHGADAVVAVGVWSDVLSVGGGKEKKGGRGETYPPSEQLSMLA